MLKISVSDVCGFSCSNEIIKVYDDRKKVFYQRLNPAKEICKFNLPKGNYFTPCNIARGEIVVYDIPTLPKPERIYPLPKKFFIVSGKNKNKCSIYMETGKIFFDRDFLNSLHRPTLTFILLHELGHYLYSGNGQDSEKKCDLFATSKMLELGYNPNQILKASLFSLTNNILSKQRKAETFFHAKKI
jgi:hypothetical protein